MASIRWSVGAGEDLREVVEYIARLVDEADDPQVSLALGTGKGIGLIDLSDKVRPAFYREMKRLIAVILFVAGCSPALLKADSAQPPENYSGPVAQQPIRTKGSFWRYEGELRGKPYYFTRIFEGAEDVDGATYHILRTGGQKRYETPELNFAFTKNVRGEVTNVVEPPLAYFHWPLWVGKQWSQKVAHTINGATHRYEQEFKVLAYEKVKTPAGEFDAFKLSRAIVQGITYEEYWYSPQVKYFVKFKGTSGTDGDVEYTLSKFELK